MDFDEYPGTQDLDQIHYDEADNNHEHKEGSRRGRKPGRKSSEKIDAKSKLERSRQSARECRARKKLRYQYLEELVADREDAVYALRDELEKYRLWNKELDEGRFPENLQALLEEMGAIKAEESGQDVAMLL